MDEVLKSNLILNFVIDFVILIQINNNPMKLIILIVLFLGISCKVELP